MRVVTAWVGIALVAVGCGGARESELQRLIEAERSFARTTAEKGIKDGFLAYLAEDAVLFRPGPVPGPEWLRSRPAPDGLLEWAPTYADVSAAGDLGYTTGPWRFAESFGHFVSVWRKQADGSWKVVLDIGTSHEDPGEGGWTPAFPPARAKGSGADDSTALDILDQDRRFLERWAEEGSSTAYPEFADEAIRFYREGARPVVGRRALVDLLADQDERWQGTPIAGLTAESGDLAFVYGRIERIERVGAESTAPAAANYLHIWTRSGGTDAWRVVLDLAMPLPAGAGSD